MKSLTMIKLIFSLAFIMILNFEAQAEKESLQDFLKRSATVVEEVTIRDGISFFLNDSYDKEQVFWLEGSIVTKKGNAYDELMLKFNTINNSLYLKRKEKSYRITSSQLESFTVNFSGNERSFKNGYVIPNSYELTASFDLSIAKALNYLLAYSDSENHRIVELSSKEKKEGGTMTIEIIMFGKIYGLQSYLLSHEKFTDVRYNELMVSEVGKNTFFEIVVEKPDFNLIKHNSKRISNSETVALVKRSQSHVFDERKFYLANKQGEIQEIEFTKKSLIEGAKSLGLDDFKEITSVGSEKKLIKVLSRM